MEIFRRHLAVQSIPLYIVEVVFGDSQPQIVGENVLHIRTDTVLWHKERALNIALQRLPEDCEYVAWLDGDIVFVNDRWAEDSIRALDDGFTLVQPFESVTRLPKIDFQTGRLPVTNEAMDSRSFAAGLNYMGYSDYPNTLQLFYGDTGFGWVARKELMLKHGFYDAGIIGGGDLTMVHAALGDMPRYISSGFFNEPQVIHILRWANPFADEVRKKIAHVQGKILHLWHGDIKKRGYNSRHAVLIDHDFNPFVDIYAGRNGLYEWASHVQISLPIQVASYFESRKEDG